MVDIETPAQPADVRDPPRAVGAMLWALALPVFGEQFCNVFVGIFDTFLAGQVSTSSIAAVGLAAYVGWLATLLSGFVGIGASALVARATGAGRHGEAAALCNQAMRLAGFVGVGVAGVVLGLSALMPSVMGLSGDAAREAVLVLRIDAGSQFLYAFMLIGAACLRGRGDTRCPMALMVLINIVNVVVSGVLALGLGPVPALGTMGIAIGTAVARSTAGLLMLAVLWRGRSGLKLCRGPLRWDAARRILRIGGPAGIEATLMWSGQFIYLTFISRVSQDPAVGLGAYAAHMIAIRLESFSFLPAHAWATAAATLVGQALGANEPQRARRAGHLAVAQMLPLGIILATTFFFLAGWIFRMAASGDEVVVAQGVPALRLAAFFQPVLITMIVYMTALRGAGDTRFPLAITVLGVFGVRLPLAYVGGVILQGGLMGAWAGMCADVTLRAALAGIRFARGNWQKTSI